MKILEFVQKLTTMAAENWPVEMDLLPSMRVAIYPRSVNKLGDDILLLGREGLEKFLYVLSPTESSEQADRFQGEPIGAVTLIERTVIKRCPMNHPNADAIRELIDFTRPVLIGLHDTIGLGDRLGIANAGHLRAVVGTKMRPILAQQSIRELDRTEREAEEVMDAATWAVFQEGYEDGWGADADHLKTTEDIDRMVKAGYLMFTIDPGDHVVNEADTLSVDDLTQQALALPWDLLGNTFDDFIARYADVRFDIDADFFLEPNREEVLRALVKYGAVIAHTVRMVRHLADRYPNHPRELELSVDETESVTSSFEHFMVVSELGRLGIELVSLAPRFVGEMEKGIDYKGDLSSFIVEYIKHLQIAEKLGPYKISFHSGSDKFSLYRAVGSLDRGCVLVKTAGTSYLEALRAIATADPGLFREILDFGREHYETEKATYHVSAELDCVPPASDLNDEQLPALLDQDDARQVLHVTFGKVLTSRDDTGKTIFKDRIMMSLKEHERLYDDCLTRHFRRHIEPFIQ
ncbi:MAG: hypothetical protein JSU77_13280 [Fidelibacterota bacterium]|nr:MAG: hypothetical protein JSU77_13280 [Candidatus Neomarinimicrobiota bacterium]